MLQHNLAIVDLSSPRSDPLNHYAGHSSYGERNRASIETEYLSQMGQRPSSTDRGVATELHSFPSGAAVTDRSIALVMSFGPFRILPNQRLLLEGGRPVHIGSRAFDILVALVERAGELVSKRELIARVWPDTFVGNDNLKVQVVVLRRTLRDGEDGNRYISTVVGRGYWFVAPVVRSTGTVSEARD